MQPELRYDVTRHFVAILTSTIPVPLTLHHEISVMQKLEFSLDGDYIELNQLLKLTGVCDSGGAGKILVTSGCVSVDSKMELRKTCKIRAGQVVSLGDMHIRVINGVDQAAQLAVN